jgi:hypothetical protein
VFVDEHLNILVDGVRTGSLNLRNLGFLVMLAKMYNFPLHIDASFVLDHINHFGVYELDLGSLGEFSVEHHECNGHCVLASFQVFTLPNFSTYKGLCEFRVLESVNDVCTTIVSRNLKTRLVSYSYWDFPVMDAIAIDISSRMQSKALQRVYNAGVPVYAFSSWIKFENTNSRPDNSAGARYRIVLDHKNESCTCSFLTANSDVRWDGDCREAFQDESGSPESG